MATGMMGDAAKAWQAMKGTTPEQDAAARKAAHASGAVRLGRKVAQRTAKGKAPDPKLQARLAHSTHVGAGGTPASSPKNVRVRTSAARGAPAAKKAHVPTGTGAKSKK